MSRVYVLDAGVLFTTWTTKIEDAVLVTTSNIMTEVRNQPSQLRAETLLTLDRLRMVNPESVYIERVSKTATRSGDSSVLSDIDIELISLALMLREEGEDAILVSSDFAVLNTASHLSIKYIDPSGKFGKEITWVLMCPACHYRSKTPTRDIECPVCGTNMRRTPLKRRNRS